MKIGLYIKRIPKFLSWLFLKSWFFSVPIFYLPLIAIFLSPNDLIPFLGVILRLIGSICILYGINIKLQKFTEGSHGIGVILKRWLNEWPFKGVTIESEPVVVFGSSYRPYITGGIYVDQNKTEKEKVVTLYKIVQKHHHEFVSFYNDMDKKYKNLKVEISKLNAKLENAETILREETKKAFTDNVELEFFGACIILLGIIFTNWQTIFGGFTTIISYL